MTALFRKEVYANRSERLFGEVVISQPLSTRYLVAFLAAVIAAAVLWVCIGTYARMETAPGTLVPDRPAPKILAPVSGIVTQLSVQEGSFVKAGQTLAIISLDRQSETGDQTLAASLGTITERTALGAEQMRLAGAQISGERARLASAAMTAEAQAADLDRQISLQTEIVASNRTLFEQVSTLVEKGYVSRIDFERRRQTWLSSQQQLGSLRQQRIAQSGQAAQARAQLASLQAQEATQQVELRSAIQSLEQQRLSLEGQKSYVVRAPVAGRVTAVQTNIGSTTNPSSPLMVIVPTDARMRAEIYAPSRAIGFVRAGQEVRLLYDAFPYQRFGSFSGRITSVSRVIIDPRESSVPVKLEEPAYKVVINLDRQTVAAFGQRYTLQPGMALNANIVLERQSFLDWLLLPLRAVSERS